MTRIVGIDEVGRGCWAGPVVAGAVMLPTDFFVPEDESWQLLDSKIMRKSDRLVANRAIYGVALAAGLGWSTSTEVDQLGLTEAVRLAMQRALSAITIEYDEVIIDGSYNFLKDNIKASTLIKADALVPAVSAASIIAKVARDDWMAHEAETMYPDYGFASHVGYGTRQHIAALQAQGPCPIHRLSYKPIKAFSA